MGDSTRQSRRDLSPKRVVDEVRRRAQAVVGRKVFCISMQRTGTTSVGRFLRDHGYHVATWDTSVAEGWTRAWFAGDYEGIFTSRAFWLHQGFEDDPWWCGDFYKVVYHRMPNARFVLLERDASKWYSSMMRHSEGRNPGNAYRHALLYGRAGDRTPRDASCYSGGIDNLLELTEAHREHYERWYVERNAMVREFFDAHDRSRLFSGRLEAPDLWTALGAYLELSVDPSYSVHMNRSSK